MSCATIPRLTLRQQAFLGLLALGATDTQIASILSLNPTQVCTWIECLCRRLDCASRDALRNWVDTVPRGRVPETGLVVHPGTGQVVWLEQGEH